MTVRQRCTRPIGASIVAGALLIGVPVTAATAASDPPVFAPGVDYPNANQDVITNGDVNGDGYQDLVTIDFPGANTVGVMLGTGDGTFGAMSTFGLSDSPGDVAAGDLNGDGRADVVAVDGQGVVSVLLGLAGGGLTAPVEYALGTSGKGVALGDVNGDGKLDAVVGSSLSATKALAVLIGNGDGTFQQPVQYDAPAGADAGWLALGDVDKDSDLDVVSSSFAGLAQWPNNGDGTFGTATLDAGAGSVRAVALGDLNGDGYPDVAFTQLSNFVGSPMVALNNGDGTFGAAQNLDVGIGSLGISVGDLNNDGNLDVVTSVDAAGIAQYLGDGSGAFGTAIVLPTGTSAKTQTVADLNDDGNLDIAGVNLPAVTVFINVAAPTITSVAPNKGTVDGGTALTIKGTGLLPGSTVKIGDKDATDVKVVNGRTITVRTPAAAAGTVDVVVTRTDAKVATLKGAFTYEVNPPPPPPSPTPTPTPTPTQRQQQLPVRSLNLPARLNNAGWTRLFRVPVRTNAGQNARWRVTGRPLASQVAGEVRDFLVDRRNGAVWVKLSGTTALKVRVRLHAGRVPGFTAYTKVKVYRTKAVG